MIIKDKFRYIKVHYGLHKISTIIPISRIISINDWNEYRVNYDERNSMYGAEIEFEHGNSCCTIKVYETVEEIETQLKHKI